MPESLLQEKNGNICLFWLILASSAIDKKDKNNLEIYKNQLI